jgi:hydroxypyruvate isomerase
MSTPMFPLAVTTEMLFRDLPYLERVRRIHDLGFQVEMWDWTVKDLDAVAALGATWSTMTGYIHGDLYDEEGGKTLVETAKLAVAAAKKIDCPRLVVHGAELDGSRGGLPFRPQAVTTGQMWLNARSKGSPTSARPTASSSAWRTSTSTRTIRACRSGAPRTR